MLATTLEVMKAGLKSDPTVTPPERSRLLALLRSGEVSPATVEKNVERILRRAEAAARFSVSPRSIDRWAKEGLLPKVTLPGHTRASGFRESDLVNLINGRAA